MSRLTGWFRSGGAKADDAGSDSDAALDSVAKERNDLQDALKWTSLIMNDDMDGASKGLKGGDSSFHELGLSITVFMRSILGFEKDIMAEASAKLNDCETRAWNDFKRAQRRGNVRSNRTVYPPGTEYELIRAETQLMSAIVGVLHENLLEGMKSFYKLRKAFITLDAIIVSEAKLFGGRSLTSVASTATAATATPSTIDVDQVKDESGVAKDEKERNTSSSSSSDSDSEAFVDAKEKPSELTTPDVPTPPPQEAASTATTTVSGSKLVQELDMKILRLSTDTPPVHPVASDVSLENPVDAFVHSGSNMCYGLLLLILSLIPPAFSRILSIVGFHGDRSRGVSMLWKSSAYPNLNGAVAGMMLLAYYNGLLGGVDILPSEEDYDEDAETVGPPRKKIESLLANMTSQYPDSGMWRIEESRLYANDKDLAKAIELLKSGPASKMKQVTALNNFELSIDAMMMQDWNLMRDSFIKCMTDNDWSPALYLYMAGCASLELYRDAFHRGDANEARVQKAKAEEYFRKAPAVSGKKRLMARQLPLETLLQHKIQKWESRAKASGIDLADSVGASPALEMVYMWNGQKRMGVVDLEKGIANLRWERCTAKDGVLAEMKKEKDEVAVWAVGMSALLRGLGKFGEAKAVLEENVLVHDRAVFKGPGKMDYVLPAATYEMGVIAWMECCSPPPKGAEAEDVSEYRRLKLEACQEYLDRAKGWEAYNVDARIGVRVQSGLETLKWFRKKMGW